MEDPAEEAVVDGLATMRVANAPREIVAKQRRESNFQVTAFQAAMAMPDLMDAQPSSSDPSTSDPSGSDDTSPSSFLGTPYSTTLQFDYPFPISNAPRDPALPPTPLPSALPIASSIGSAPSIVTAAAASEENSELAPANHLPSLVSSIAASPDLPVNNNLSDLRSLPNRSSSSLNSTHSGHTAPGMVAVMPSNASVHSVSPSSSFQSNSHISFGVAGSPLANSNSGSMSRNKGRPHSLNLSQMPPPSLSLQTNMVKTVHSPPIVQRPKAQAVSSFTSTGSDMSHESFPVSTGQSRPASGSVSSLSIASVSLLTGPGEPPIPPSLLNKLGQRPRNTSTASNTSSYFTANVNIYKTHNSRDFFGSPINEGTAPFASAPNSPPQTLATDSSVDMSKPMFSPSKANFSIARPQLGRSSSTTGHGLPTFSKPFFGRASTAQQVSTGGPNSAFQGRAYAQHLRYQQEQQKLKLQEELRKKAEKEAKAEKKKEKKEKKDKEKKRRPSLSLSRTPSASSSSSSKTKASSQSKSPPSSSASQTEMFKLSPSQRNSAENAIDESEDSTSPEGMKRTKPRRRSSVRRALEKAGSKVASGFKLDISASKRGATPLTN